MKKILAVLVLFFCSATAEAAIRYVSKDGCGGVPSPCHTTIQAAFTATASGDTIRIRNAATAYDEHATLTVSGSSGNPITIEPDTGHNPTLRYAGAGTGDAVIRLQKVSYVTVRNLNFNGSGVNTSAYALWLEAAVSCSNASDMLGIKIQNNTFQNWGGSGSDATATATRAALLISGGYCNPASPGKPKGTEVTGNVFDSNRQVNVLILAANDTVLDGNEIKNAKCGKDVDNAVNTIGVKVIDAIDVNSTGTIFRNNSLHDWQTKANCDVPHVSGSYDTLSAFWCDVGPDNGLVEKNTINNINQGDSADSTYAAQGLFIEANCEGWIIRNNVISNVGVTGMRQRMSNSSGVADQWLNNTVVKSGKHGLQIATGPAIIKNNIFYDNGQAQIHFDSTSSPGYHTINYNDYWDTAGGNKVGQWGGSTLSFATWKSTCSCDANSINADPLFVNAAGGDYNLQSGSPARKSGEAGVDMGALPASTATVKIKVTTY